MRQVAADRGRVEALFTAWSSASLSTDQSREIEGLTAKFALLATTYANEG